MSVQSAENHALDVAVRARFGDFAIDVSMRIEPGLTALFGPSGSGKSSTLAVIAGLGSSATGRIACGTSVWLESEKAIHVPTEQRRVGLVFQSLALFPHMSAIDNVLYGMHRQLPLTERQDRARALLAELGVEHVAARMPSLLSGGEAQRVAVARALAIEPRVLLLDEPFTGLESKLRRALGDVVSGVVRRRAIPAILVTHDVREARALAKNAVILHQGRVTARCSTNDLEE